MSMSRKHLNELGAYAEMALMGCLVPVSNDEDLKELVKYIAKVISKSDPSTVSEEVVSGAYKYNSSGTKVTHLVVNTLEDMVLLTLVRDEQVKVVPTDLITSGGVLAYVYNLSYPDLSELGYVFFAQKNGFIKRIG